MSIASSKEMKDVIEGMRELLGLPDEGYQELNIFMKIGDVVRVEAKFIAKGKEDNNA